MSRAVHFDASKPGQVLRWGLCGFSGETDTDITKVSCKGCRKRLSKGAGPAKERKARGNPAAGAADELARLLAPKAPPPPRLDAGAWSGCCDASEGSAVRRCGECALCQWEREANLWGSREVSAHNDAKQHRTPKLPGAPRWSSVNKALIAYAEYHAHQRHARSATAGILARIEFGSDTDGGLARPDDPLQRAADDIVAVEQALHAAYPEGAHALPQRARIALLLARTPGVAPEQVDAKGVAQPTALPTYEELAARLALPAGELQALVNTGRERAAWHLFERGLIGRPQELRRDARQGRRRMVGVEPEPEVA